MLFPYQTGALFHSFSFGFCSLPTLFRYLAITTLAGITILYPLSIAWWMAIGAPPASSANTGGGGGGGGGGLPGNCSVVTLLSCAGSIVNTTWLNQTCPH